MNKNLAHFAHHFFSMQGSLPIGLKILVTPLYATKCVLYVKGWSNVVLTIYRRGDPKKQMKNYDFSAKTREKHIF